MNANITCSGRHCPTTNRIPTLLLLGCLAVLLEQTVTAWANRSSADLAEVSAVHLRNWTLTFYRSPDHANPPVNYLDPYDSFQKDSNGGLVLVARMSHVYSPFAQADYNEYILKTRKGNPVVVYQETPSRRRRHKSNCHGYTFLDGDYWLLSSQVQKILIDNKWVIVPHDQVAAGDIAVYKELDGTIVHTATVTGKDSQGHVLVSSKNGFELALENVPATSVVP